MSVVWSGWTAPLLSAEAEEALVAVATNFAPLARELAIGFEETTDHELRLASGSTGKLYAQIVSGAPFDVFLAADSARPARLVEEGRARADSRRTYAKGRLVLWSADPGWADTDGAASLRAGDFRKLAMANPELAPYGSAAREALVSLGVFEGLRGRLVFGENVGQAFALVATGNAELGLVAASQVAVEEGPAGRGWVVPSSLHAPIRQDGVLLRRAEDNAAALSFLDYLASDAVRRRIRAAGYEVD